MHVENGGTQSGVEMRLIETGKKWYGGKESPNWQKVIDKVKQHKQVNNKTSNSALPQLSAHQYSNMANKIANFKVGGNYIRS